MQDAVSTWEGAQAALGVRALWAGLTKEGEAEDRDEGYSEGFR